MSSFLAGLLSKSAVQDDAKADVQPSMPADVQESKEDEDDSVFGNLFSQFEQDNAGDS